MTPPLVIASAPTTDFVTRPDARRFENWESYVAGRLGLGAAVDYALDLGLGPIWNRVQRQATLLRTRLGTIDGVSVHDAGEIRGGIVTFSRCGITPGAIKDALANERINVSLSNIYRTYFDSDQDAIGTFIRASVQYLTTDDEIERLADVLESLRA